MNAFHVVAVVLALLLAAAMVPVAGIQSAFADEPVARPVMTGGDVSLNGSTAGETPVAQQREDGIVVADGLVYTVADGGLALVGFDDVIVEGEDAVERDIALVVPAAVSVDGKDVAVVVVDIAQGQVDEGALSLTLPQSVEDITVATLAGAFPNLASINVAAAKASSAPVAVGAAAMRAAYSSFAGLLFRNVREASPSDTSLTVTTKELVWAPPATIVARIPAECTSIARGAFADCKDLQTVVAFGTIETIAIAEKDDDGEIVEPGAFTDEQIDAVNVIVPQTGTVVSRTSKRVSASVALAGDEGMDVRRASWVGAGFASDRITLGETYGSTTNAVAVAEDGTVEAVAKVVSAPETTQNSSGLGAYAEGGTADAVENGLVFTHLADMTLSVSWKGDPTATPAHIDIPAYAMIDGVTYPVTEIAAKAFKEAVFLTSVAIPEGIKTIGASAFEGCANLTDAILPTTNKTIGSDAFSGTRISEDAFSPAAAMENAPTAGLHQETLERGQTPAFTSEDASVLTTHGDSISSYAGNFTVKIVVNYDTKEFLLASLICQGNLVKTGDDASEGDHQRRITLTATCSTFAAAYDVRYGYDFYVDDVKSWLNLNTLAGYKYENSAISTTSAYTSISWQHGVSVAEDATIFITRFAVPDVSGFATTTALNTKVTSSDISNYNTNAKLDAKFNTKLDSSAISSYNTNAKLDAKFNTKADLSDFGTISYDGIDANDQNVYPTTYRKGGSPTLPKPQRTGHTFTGWTWAGQAMPTTDAVTMKNAFAAGGAVTLTAHWTVQDTGYFFSDADPYRAGGGPRSYTIAVRLADAGGKRLSRATFEDNASGLVADGSAISFEVGTAVDSSGVLTGTTLNAAGLGASTTGNIQLVQLGDQAWGVYVRVTIPQGAIASDEVTQSYTDGSYVARFVKMNYQLA